jgi:pyrroline-5-carboxylate reductase
VKSKQLSETFSNVYRLDSNQLVLDRSDIIFIAVRPGISREVLSDLKFSKDHTVVSLIPSLQYSELIKILEPATRISRAIPLPTVVNHKSPIPIFNPDESVINIIDHIGQPLVMEDENQLHTIWALTGLIAPFFDLLAELNTWAASKGVKETTSSKYIADMFQSISFMAQKTSPLAFDELVNQYATPNGMNEQARKEISDKGLHKAYKIAADNLLIRLEKIYTPNNR